MKKKLHIGFTKQFETSEEAFAFLADNSGNCELDAVLGIPVTNPTTVIVSKSFWTKEEKNSLNVSWKPKWHPDDTLGNNVNGIINHADGKRYDSKSNYEKAVRAKGCRVVGNDWNNSEWKPPIERGIQGDFNVRPQLKEALNKVLG